MSDDKKIIIDEDWKSKVQKEKQAAAESASPAPPEQPRQASQSSGDAPSQMPVPDLPTLIEWLAANAMNEMGFGAEPGQKARIQLPAAKYFIDLLGMLQEKTQGNRTGEESEMLEGLLHQLRMAFISLQRGGQ